MSTAESTPEKTESTLQPRTTKTRSNISTIGGIVCAICLAYWLGSSLQREQSGLGDYRSKNVDWNERREEVKQAFVTSWDAYSKYAWGTW